MYKSNHDTSNQCVVPFVVFVLSTASSLLSPCASFFCKEKSIHLCRALSGDDLDVAMLLSLDNLLLNLLEVVVADLGVVTVDDARELLEGRSLGLDELPEDEEELEADPAL